jgi:hypothetical protein
MRSKCPKNSVHLIRTPILFGAEDDKLTKNIPVANSTYGASLKLAQSTRAPVFLGGTLGFSPMLQRQKQPSWIKAIALIVQGNPILGSNCFTMAGKIIPPVALPEVANPIAKLLFFEKYVLNKLSAGQNRHPYPIPQQTPWARNNCQYLVDKDVMKTPIIATRDPVRKTRRKYPASVNRPVNVPMKKRRKTWIEPTHEMSDGDLLSAVT